MPKSSLDEIASGIAEALRKTGKFETVTTAAISSGVQLFDVLEGLTRLPGAVAAISGADFDEEGLVRTLRVLVVVADRFRRGAAARASGVWELLETVETLAETGLESCGIPFTLLSWEPVDTGKETIAAFAVTLEGAEA